MSNLRLFAPTLKRRDRPLFIFLPGMDGTGLLYQRQAEDLANDFDVRCLAISPEDHSDWDELTEEALALIKAENKSTIYLCGESFGGCLALKIAFRIPNLIQKLILVNPATSFNESPWLGLAIPLTQIMPDWLHPPSALALLPFLAALGRISQEDRHLLLKAMRTIPCKTIAWRLSLLRQFKLNFLQLHRFRQPVLYLAGGSDCLLPSVAAGKKLCQCFPHSQLLVLPHSGHACLLESEVKLVEILQINHASSICANSRNV